MVISGYNLGGYGWFLGSFNFVKSSRVLAIDPIDDCYYQLWISSVYSCSSFVPLIMLCTFLVDGCIMCVQCINLLGFNLTKLHMKTVTDPVRGLLDRREKPPRPWAKLWEDKEPAQLSKVDERKISRDKRDISLGTEGKCDSGNMKVFLFF